MRWSNFGDNYEPVVVTWETKTAKFIHIEISPYHTFRIKIDKVVNKKKEGVG